MQKRVAAGESIQLKGESRSRKPASIQQRVGGAWERLLPVTVLPSDTFRAEATPMPSTRRNYILRARQRTTRVVRRQTGCRWSFSRRVRVRGAPYRQLRGMVSPHYVKQQIEQTERDLDEVADLHSDVVRFNFAWALIETAPGVYSEEQIATIDRLMAAAQARGLRVIATLASTPCWAVSQVAAGQACVQLPPDDSRSFGHFAGFFASRWGDHLAGIEVWSEPNFDRYFLGDAADYAALVEQAARGVHHSAHPEIPIAAGALLFSDIEYLRSLYEYGLARWSDAVSVHPYDIHADFGDPLTSRPGDVDSRSFAIGIPQVRELMLEYGDREPIWITEFGYASCPATPLCVDPAVQAQWLTDAIATAAGWPYVKMFVVFTLRDRGGDYWEGRFGLLDAAGVRKPAWQAVAEQFSLLP